MGTIGQRFAHADRGLMVEDSVSPNDVKYDSTRAGLLRADAAVELAVGR